MLLIDIWTGASGIDNNWNTPANWNTGIVPTVRLQRHHQHDGTVNLTGPAIRGQLNVVRRHYHRLGALSVVGPLTWTGGSMSGAGSTTVGSLVLASLGSMSLVGWTLTNTGSGTWQSGQLLESGGAQFINQGTFMTQGVGLSWSADAGSGIDNAGSMTIAAGSPVAVSGDGTLTQSGGSLTLDSNMSLANFTATGGTFIGNAVLTVTGQLIISGGTVSGDPIDVVRNFSNPAAITLSSGQIYTTPALSNVTLLAIEQQYDLLDPTGNGSYFYNARGGEEKYLVSGNGSNPAGGGYYVLLPNGNLYAWTGNSLTLSLTADPVASAGVAAYANPSLLISPPVAYNATVYDTEQSLALTGPALTTPQYEYFVSANGSNAGHGGGYILVANGNLYAWQGTFAASVSGPATILGSVYYQNPTGLTDPTPPDNLNQVSAGISGGILTVADSTSGDNGFLGTALVAFSTASTSYNVDVTFSDTAPVWTGPGNQTVILPTTKQTSALSLNATDTAGNALTYTAAGGWL